MTQLSRKQIWHSLDCPKNIFFWVLYCCTSNNYKIFHRRKKSIFNRYVFFLAVISIIITSLDNLLFIITYIILYMDKCFNTYFVWKESLWKPIYCYSPFLFFWDVVRLTITEKSCYFTHYSIIIYQSWHWNVIWWPVVYMHHSSFVQCFCALNSSVYLFFVHIIVNFICHLTPFLLASS